MSTQEITVLTDVALITCIVQRGMGEGVLKAAQEAGAQGATLHYARGSGVRERLGVLGVSIEVEKVVVDIVVATDQVDRVFEHIYLAAKLDTPGMGMMYVTPIEKAATHVPQDIVDRLTSRGSAV